MYVSWYGSCDELLQLQMLPRVDIILWKGPQKMAAVRCQTHWEPLISTDGRSRHIAEQTGCITADNATLPNNAILTNNAAVTNNSTLANNATVANS
jgi:hypothetical protein